MARIATEYARNGSLEDALRRVKNGDIPSFWTHTNISIMIVGLVLGMRYLHGRGIIHRDLKPANLLLDGQYRILICDFGNAKFESCGTISSGVNCTVAYAAPEVLFDDPITRKVDVFSFGLILYEILVGDSVFPKTVTGMKRVVSMQAQDKRPEIPSNIESRVRDLIERCWSPDPSDRLTFREIFMRLDRMGFALFNDVDVEAVRRAVEDMETLEESLIFPAGFSTMRVPWNRVQFRQNAKNVIGEWQFGQVYRGIGREYYKIPGSERKKSRFLNLAVKKAEIHDLVDQQQIFIELGQIPTLPWHPCLLGLVSWSLEEHCLAFEWEEVKLCQVFEKVEQSTPFEYEAPDGDRVEWNDTKRSICAFGIAVGMCYLEKHGVVHGDLTPANIALDELLYPRIGEYGVSGCLGSKIPLDRSPTYTAPEVLSGGQKVSFPADVWSYGMIVCELVTQRKPSEERPGFDAEALDGVSTGFRELIEACLSMDPGNRPTFRQIIEQANNDEELVLPGTDLDEFREYREEVIKGFG
jgi:serine/threonine protein kinase